ncbi:hypothetical protein J6TS7_40690 [Paenibacillus dendritiformis]|nr:hypothetical protein J6TS7_40690 [Paenibacillus dendritiformis]
MRLKARVAAAQPPHFLHLTARCSANNSRCSGGRLGGGMGTLFPDSGKRRLGRQLRRCHVGCRSGNGQLLRQLPLKRSIKHRAR